MLCHDLYIYIECHYDEYRYAECRFAERHYVERRGTFKSTYGPML